MQNHALIGLRSIARPEFVIHVGNGGIDFLMPVPVFGDLLRAERDKHAQNDHAHLAEECAPAVQRLRKLQMHSAGPPAPSLTDGLMSAMGGTRTLLSQSCDHRIDKIASAAVRGPLAPRWAHLSCLSK